MSVNSNVICSVRTDTEVMCIRSIWEPHQEMVRPAPNGDERYFTGGAFMAKKNKENYLDYVPAISPTVRLPSIC